MTASQSKTSLMKRLMRWIVPEQRVANRHPMPPVVAYLGSLRSSKLYKIADISIAGFYMVTEDKWIPGTGFPVTLQRTDDGAQGQTLTAYCTVVRVGPDGVAFSFLQAPDEDRWASEARAKARLDLTKLAHFLKGLRLSEPNSDPFERAS